MDDLNNMEFAPGTLILHGPVNPPPIKENMFGSLVILRHLIDRGRYTEARNCVSTTIFLLKKLRRLPITELTSRVYYYYSLSYELTRDLAQIRGDLLLLYQKTILCHDVLGQETLFNLILRNYLHYNLYDQAEKFRSMAPRVEAHSNQQFCKYLFYLGKIRTIQLEYTEAKESFLQAALIAPPSALGFRVQCNKWAIIVRLLLGEIPERTVFMQKGMEKGLWPYFELTKAVRTGNLKLVQDVAEAFSFTFSLDRTRNLIARLRRNVITIGLRNISTSYSRISLADIVKKLRLDAVNSASDAESMVSKAIRDGAFDATVDHANGWMVWKKPRDVYSTNEPQIAFHPRIVFCLNMHNKAVKAHESQDDRSEIVLWGKIRETLMNLELARSWKSTEIEEDEDF